MKEEINDDFPNMPADCHIKLKKIAKEYILKNIQSSIFNINGLRRMMTNFTNSLNLKNFLDNYGIDIDRFYSKYSFYELLTESVYDRNYEVRDKKELKQSLRRFSKINSKRLLYFSRRILYEDLDLSLLNKVDRLMMGMFHYTVWGNRPNVSYEKSFKELREHNPDIARELLDIIEYNLDNIKCIEIKYEDEEIPLDIYASYNIYIV